MSDITITPEDLASAQGAFFSGVVRYAKAAGRPVAEFAAQFAIGGCMMIERNLKQAEISAKRKDAQSRQVAAEAEVDALNAELREIEAKIQAAATGQSA